MKTTRGYWADPAWWRQALTNPTPPFQAADERAGARPAAVLVPLIARANGVQVLLTRRSSRLRHHPGQVSFPGGAVEASDRSFEDTALRETGEELGIDRADMETLGTLPCHHTISGFDVTPVVGWLAANYQFKAQTAEVDEAFEAPLAFFLDASNRHQRSVVWRGERRSYFEYCYHHHVIWGATAAMFDSLRQVVAQRDSGAKERTP